MTVGSLFAGIGGFDLGFERAGFDITWQVEIDPWARAVLAKHWPHVHRHDDIRTAGAHNLETVDVLCGGFPCQDISLAGKGAGLGEGTRSGLWSEYARLIRELRPRYGVVENVSALLARGLGRVVGDLAACGYDAEWDCIPAAAVGAPHRRDRLWLVAYPSGVQQRGGREHAGAYNARYPRARLVSGPTARPAVLADALHDGREERPVPEGQGRQAVSDATRRGRPGADVADAKGTRFPQSRHARTVAAGTSGIFAGATIDRDGWWAVEPNVGRVASGVPARVDRLRGLGNAIVPQIAEWLAHRINDAEARRLAA
jgi:DNA (cytosine-5)-methyltransferase 1